MASEPKARFQLPCVIFAGGKSSRMGRDKALLPFGGVPTLVEYQYDRLSPLFTETYISAKTSGRFPHAFPLIIDDPDIKDAAPTAGFISLFKALDSERAFVLSVDAPFIGRSVIEALMAADRPDLDAVIARTPKGIHPLCGIYHRSLLKTFETMAYQGRHALGRMLEQQRVVYVDFFDEGNFANLNHPHEYEAARSKALFRPAAEE